MALPSIMSFERTMIRFASSSRRHFASSSRSGAEASTSSVRSNDSKGTTPRGNGRKNARAQRRESLQPSHMRSSRFEEEDVGEEIQRPDPVMRVARTDWTNARFADPAPPVASSRFLSPLPETSVDAHKSNKYIGVGPGASNETSLRHAERALHMHLSDGRRFVGQLGTTLGVPFGRSGHALSSKQATEQLTAQQRQQLYLEREGGDYSRYLKKGGEDDEDWERTSRQALGANASIAAESKEGLIAQMSRILDGTPFGDPVIKEKKAKVIPVAPEAPAAGPGKGKGKGKKGR